jgi:hypothetical protein
MKTILLSVHKASSAHTGNVAPSATIHVTNEIGDEEALAPTMNNDAASLENALWETLPQGTYDRLYACIVRRKASILIVSGASLQIKDVRPVDALLPAALRELRERVTDYVCAPFALLNFSGTDVMDEAAVLLSVFPRSALPDWVEILANGNRNEAHTVIGIALRDMAEEDYANGRN